MPLAAWSLTAVMSVAIAGNALFGQPVAIAGIDTTPADDEDISYGRSRIFAGETVTIPSGHILFSVGDLFIEDGGQLILEDGAQLFDLSTLGGIIQGRFVALRTGHRHNIDLVKQAIDKAAVVRDAIVAAGRLGQKTAAGYYKYDENRKRIPDPEVERIILGVAAAQGVGRRKISDEEILERVLLPMVNEGARLLADWQALALPRSVPASTHASPLDALAAAVAAADPADRIVVFGSFFTVGGLLAAGLPRLGSAHLG